MTNLMNIFAAAAKVLAHINKHSNSQFDNEIKTLSDKQKNIENNLNAINFKEGNQESKYKKLLIERNLIMCQPIDSHSIIHHSFDDDLQLQMFAPPDRISELLHSMQSCISDVKAWATANMLKLNDSKTELMLVTSKRSKHLHNLPTSITIGNAQIPFKQSVKNLGFTFVLSSYYECTCLQYCSYMLL